MESEIEERFSTIDQIEILVAQENGNFRALKQQWMQNELKTKLYVEQVSVGNN